MQHIQEEWEVNPLIKSMSTATLYVSEKKEKVGKRVHNTAVSMKKSRLGRLWAWVRILIELFNGGFKVSIRSSNLDLTDKYRPLGVKSEVMNIEYSAKYNHLATLIFYKTIGNVFE